MAVQVQRISHMGLLASGSEMRLTSTSRIYSGAQRENGGVRQPSPSSRTSCDATAIVGVQFSAS